MDDESIVYTVPYPCWHNPNELPPEHEGQPLHWDQINYDTDQSQLVISKTVFARVSLEWSRMDGMEGLLLCCTQHNELALILCWYPGVPDYSARIGMPPVDDGLVWMDPRIDEESMVDRLRTGALFGYRAVGIA